MSSRCVGVGIRPVAVAGVRYVAGLELLWGAGCLAPTLTVFDLVIMIMGQLASFGLP